MSIARHHAEWLSLLEISGPILSMSMLLDAFPQELDAYDAEQGGEQLDEALARARSFSRASRPAQAICIAPSACSTNPQQKLRAMQPIGQNAPGRDIMSTKKKASRG